MTSAVSASDSAEICVWDVFDEIGWNPHEGQAQVIESPARNRVVAGGRRVGKSQIGGHELVPECLLTYGQLRMLEDEERRREFWIVGPEYSDSEKEFRVVWNSLKKLEVPFDRPGSYNDPIQGSLHLSCFDGAFQVHGRSAKHPETLVGEGLSGVIMAEAAKLKERVWTKFIRPTLADYEGWSLFASTPEGKNWFYKIWQAGKDPMRPDWDSFRLPSWINPHVYRMMTDPQDVKRAQKLLKEKGKYEPQELLETLANLHVDDEIMALLRDLTPETFGQEVAAEFSEYVGRVFKEWDEELHVRDLPFNPKWQTYAAVDYGFTNPFVWLLIQVGPWNEIHVIGEYYEQGKTISEAASELTARGLAPEGMLRFYPDPASPGESKELSEKLKISYAHHDTGGELRDRIDAIRKALRGRPEYLPEGHEEKIPQLLIDRSCVNMIREMDAYRYPKSVEEANLAKENLPEAPLKKDDHTPEALGRFFAGHYAARENEAPRTTRIRKSTMG